MKNKFKTQENGSMLGETIQQVRKAKKITQEELGKRVGLPKSSISKIEKGLTHISFEDASLLMEAMGEKMSIQVMGMREPDERRVERVRFVTIGVMWYAHSKKMAFADAYRYLLVYKGIQFLEENYAYEQTLPRETLLNDIDKVCSSATAGSCSRSRAGGTFQPYRLLSRTDHSRDCRRRCNASRRG